MRKINEGTYCYVIRSWRKSWVGHVVRVSRHVEHAMVMGPNGVQSITGWLVTTPWGKKPCWVCPEEYLFPIHQPGRVE